MSILEFILLLMKLVNALFNWAQENKWIKVGEDRAVAEAARILFIKTEHSRQINAKIDAMSEAEVDDLLTRLGQSDATGVLRTTKG